MQKGTVLSYLKKIPRSGWILTAIIAVGIFLRTYNFQQWLYFYPDQARDVMIVDDFLSGKAGLPLLGFKAASTNFQLGAMYSYFQIISAKLFGSSPATDAYPDVLFGILTIPLLYYFLKRYFSTNISLALAGLYSVSFYAIRYSRFAWNTNPIPFFAILFLLAFHEFLFRKNKTSWTWIALVGISIGVGVQLHTVLLVLLPIITVLGFVYALKHDGKVWKKCVIIFLIALFLNGGQLLSETKSNFSNTRYFFSVLNDRSPSQSGGIVDSFVSNVICQSQSNVLYLSSLENNDNCDNASSLKYDKQAKEHLVPYLIIVASIFFGFSIFILGYLLLFYYFKKEQDEKKKIFLGLNLAYVALVFLVVFPIITHNGQVRYWLPAAFFPFLSFGLAAKYISKKITKNFQLLGFLLLLVLILMNFFTIFSEAGRHTAGMRSNAQYVVLGELEKINQYILSQSLPKNSAYIFGGQKYMQNFYKPLFYVASRQNFLMIRGGRDPKKIPDGEHIFFIGQNLEIGQDSKYDSAPADLGLNIKSYKSFGNIGVYEVTN